MYAIKTMSHKAYYKQIIAVFLHYPHLYDNQTANIIIAIVFGIVKTKNNHFPSHEWAPNYNRIPHIVVFLSFIKTLPFSHFPSHPSTSNSFFMSSDTDKKTFNCFLRLTKEAVEDLIEFGVCPRCLLRFCDIGDSNF